MKTRITIIVESEDESTGQRGGAQFWLPADKYKDTVHLNPEAIAARIESMIQDVERRVGGSGRDLLPEASEPASQPPSKPDTGPSHSNSYFIREGEVLRATTREAYYAQLEQWRSEGYTTSSNFGDGNRMIAQRGERARLT